MRILLYNLGRLISVIFPHNALKALFSIGKYIRTGYITEGIKEIGKRVTFGSGSVIIGSRYISIGDFTTIGKRVVLSVWNTSHYNPQLVIGMNVSIGDDCHITSINKIIIGSGTLLGKKITITDNSHGFLSESEIDVPPINRNLVSKGTVIINDNVWIGDKATILPGVSIGKSAIIGANAVITKNIPAGAIAVGNPAIIIKIIH